MVVCPECAGGTLYYGCDRCNGEGVIARTEGELAECVACNGARPKACGFAKHDPSDPNEYNPAFGATMAIFRADKRLWRMLDGRTLLLIFDAVYVEGDEYREVGASDG